MDRLTYIQVDKKPDFVQEALKHKMRMKLLILEEENFSFNKSDYKNFAMFNN